MSSDSKEKSPQITFQPPKRVLPVYDVDEIHEIYLPGITTVISKIENFKPNIVPLKAVEASSEHQRYVDYATHSIDPSLISSKKSNTKSKIQYYTAKKLKDIATNLGIDGSKFKKPELAEILLQRVKELTAERKA